MTFLHFKCNCSIFVAPQRLNFATAFNLFYEEALGEFLLFVLFVIRSYFKLVFCIPFYLTELPTIRKFSLSCCAEEGAKALEFSGHLWTNLHLPKTCNTTFHPR